MNLARLFTVQSQYLFIFLHSLSLVLYLILPEHYAAWPLILMACCSIAIAISLWVNNQRRDLHNPLQQPLLSPARMQLLQQMVNDLPTRIYWRDANLQIIGANQSFISDFALSDDQSFTQRSEQEFAWLEKNPVLRERDTQTLDQRLAFCNEQIRLELPSGEHWIEHSSVPLYDENQQLIGILGSYYDVSRIRAYAEEMTTAKEAAEQASEAKGEFLANMSHEIRTPINAIIGMATLSLKTELTEKQKRYIKVIDSSSKALLGVINDVLDFSKIEAGKLTIESIPFDLEDVLETLADMFAYKAYDKDLEFIINLPSRIPTLLLGDPLRLNQVLVNLVSNAIKFTEEGEINVAVTLLDQQDDKVWLRISVTDTGIGMDEEQRANLFKAFTQADTSTTRKYGGTGLGLAISRRIIKLMPQGDIGVISAQDAGSTFYIELALPVQQAQDTSHHQTLLKRLDGTRILAIDDNLSTREMLYELLRSYGMEVKVARTAEQALDILEHSDLAPFQLALVDWRLPGMDGLEFCQQVQERGLKSKPKLILATGYYAEELAEQAIKVGASDFITKPYTASTLARVLTSVLGGKNNVERTGEQAFQIPEQLQHAPILVVEDNEINQHVARELLSAHGFQVDLAENGQVALEKVQQQRYAIVLMDIQMPVMDGYRATEAIRRHFSYQQLPILAMTANAMTGDAEKSLAAGMQAHVPKPIDEKDLLNAILKWCVPGPYRAGTDHSQLANEASISPLKTDIKYPRIRGIDFAAAMSRLQNNVDLYHRLIEQLVDEYSNSALKIADFISKGQQESARRFFHSLKGASGNLGLTALHKHAGQLEQFMAAGEIDKVADQITRIDPLLDDALQAVSDLRLQQQRQQP